MRPAVAYVTSYAAMVVGAALIIFADGIGRAAGVLLEIGGILGAVLAMSRPSGTERTRHVPQD